MSESIEPDERVPLRTFPKVIDAACYNRVRLALLRIANPLRLALPRHPGLDIILEDDAWLCVDGARDDLPILAWRQFESATRAGLHDPVHCRLHVYHLHGGLIMGTALEALDEELAVRLDRHRRTLAEQQED